MKLHHFARSSASYRVRIVAALKGIELEYVVVDMPGREQQGEAYARLNAQRMVPCLELDDGRVIPQSLAIIQYLDTLYPEPDIWPSDPVARAQAHSLCLMVACETAPLQGMMLQRLLQDRFGLSAEQTLEWLTYWIHRGLKPLEIFLECRELQTPLFSMGDTPGIVEAFLLPQLANCARFGVDTLPFPRVNAVAGTALADPRIAAAHPDRWL